MELSPCVFLSHTRLDRDFCDRFDNICANVGIRRFRSEFAYIERPSWRTIKKQLGESRALFLLVGKKLVEQQAKSDSPDWKFTQNWISYEVGIAHQRNIDVWVICESAKINFPVPYFNNYLPFGLEGPDRMAYLAYVLSKYQQDDGFSFEATQGRLHASCPACGIDFNLHVSLQAGRAVVIVCPQCLYRRDCWGPFPPSPEDINR